MQVSLSLHAESIIRVETYHSCILSSFLDTQAHLSRHDVDDDARVARHVCFNVRLILSLLILSSFLLVYHQHVLYLS